MAVGWVHPWVGLGWVGLGLNIVEMGWVGFSYQHLYIFRQNNYQTDISLFTSDCSHPVFLAVVWIQATVSNDDDDDDDDDDNDDDDGDDDYDDDDYYDEIGKLHIFAFADIFSRVLLQLMHYVDVRYWVGLGRVRSAYVSCELGWIGSVN